jgi:hypothetical protein
MNTNWPFCFRGIRVIRGRKILKQERLGGFLILTAKTPRTPRKTLATLASWRFLDLVHGAFGNLTAWCYNSPRIDLIPADVTIQPPLPRPAPALTPHRGAAGPTAATLDQAACATAVPATPRPLRSNPHP